MAKPFKNIATAIAFSPKMEANICESVRIRNMLGEKLFLIHIGEEDPQQGKAQMEKVLGEMNCGPDEYEIIWEHGDTVEAIVRVTRDYHIDLLISGAIPKEGLLRYYMGSVARKLVRKVNCSILLMTNAKKLRERCRKIVVNGLDHPKTPHTIKVAMQVGENLGAEKIVVLQEIKPTKTLKKADDDKALEKAASLREQYIEEDEKRVEKIIAKHRQETEIAVENKAIVGPRGYTIGHYTQQNRAGLLVLNSPDTKLGFLDRVFTHDLEYILSELPSPVLIVHSSKNQSNK